MRDGVVDTPAQEAARPTARVERSSCRVTSPRPSIGPGAPHRRSRGASTAIGRRDRETTRRYRASELRQWLKVEEDPAEYAAFLDQYIFGVRDFAEYIDRCGGMKRLQELRQREFLLDRGR